MAKFLKTY